MKRNNNLQIVLSLWNCYVKILCWKVCTLVKTCLNHFIKTFATGLSLLDKLDIFTLPHLATGDLANLEPNFNSEITACLPNTETTSILDYILRRQSRFLSRFITKQTFKFLLFYCICHLGSRLQIRRYLCVHQPITKPDLHKKLPINIWNTNHRNMEFCSGAIQVQILAKYHFRWSATNFGSYLWLILPCLEIRFIFFTILDPV